ncbi:MAG: hypothetical protein LLF83_06055 [Methanobacterium sp.]|nr:hypothetical protein [Methanobacterium sp.]
MSNQEILNKTGMLIFILIFLLATVSVVAAHQPRLVTGMNTSISNPIVILNPEVSQAFYGELKGQPDYYKINSDKPFKFYLNLLVPASPGIPPDYISAEVIDSSGKTIMTINGTNSTWETYFEEFGGDYYLKGPEVRADLNAGTYYIKVFNAKNQGKYSIAVGEIESFPIDESLAAIVTIPLLKEQIFGKPVTILFFQFLGIILALGTIMVQFFLLLKSRKSEELTELTSQISNHLKPFMWLGLIITTIIWLYVMYKDPLNIVGIINTILLIIILVLSWNIGNKLKKLEYGKVPLIRSIIWVILWWIFVYWTIAVI